MSALLGAGAVTMVSMATAQSYCTIGGCTVYGAPYPGGSWGGGSGSGGWGGGTTGGQPGMPTGTGCQSFQMWGPGGCYDTKAQMCEALQINVPQGCNVNSPPPLIPNGCGSGANVGFIPDSLLVPSYVVNGPSVGVYDSTAYVVAPFGDIFRAACNLHDTCYGTWGEMKSICDADLKADMIQRGYEVIPSSQQNLYMPYVTSQANLYSQGLQNWLVKALVSDAAFANAQKEGQCRAYRDLIQEFCTP